MDNKKIKQLKIMIIVLLSIGFYVYMLIINQDIEMLRKKEMITAMGLDNVELCSYKGYQISESCQSLYEPHKSILLYKFISSNPSVSPSKIEKTRDEILKFTGFDNNGKRICLCFNLFSFSELSTDLYFSPLSMNMSCTKIIRRDVGVLKFKGNLKGTLPFN